MAQLTLRRPWRILGFVHRRARTGRPHELAIPAWPRWRWVCHLRAFFQRIAGAPFMRLTYRIDVAGAEHLQRTEAPLLIVSNHTMSPDWAMLLVAMPPRFRRSVIVAGAADDIFGKRVKGFFASLVGNAFPFAKAGTNVRSSLEFVAGRLGENWSVLMFPEGKRTPTGPMEPFKPGVGWLVARTGVDVLPMRVDVLSPGLWEGARPFRRGHVRVSIGPPLRFESGASYAVVASALEAAVREA